MDSDLSTAIQKIEITAVDTFEQMKAYAAEWNQLAAQSPLRLPMLAHAWVAPYLKHRLGTGESWTCLLARENSSLIGVLPIIRSKSKPFRQQCRLRVPYPTDILIATGREKEIISLFMTGLERIFPHRHELSLKRIHHQSPSISILSPEKINQRVVRDFDGYGTYMEITGTYDSFRARLSSGFRRNIQKATRQLMARGNIRLEHHHGKSITDQDLETFIQIEGSGWKGRTGSAIARKSSKSAYYAELIKHLQDLNWLHWYFLLLDDRPIAGLLAIRMENTLVFEKMGYEEAFAAFSPGHVLFEKILESVFKIGEIKEINFLSDDPWISVWHPKKRLYYNLFLYPRRSGPTLVGYLPRRLLVGLRRLGRDDIEK
ncbi:MAG: GNAT family N-acetyltransferase [FCB group bacterium]|nr:GNAT family N-acetyltransferase [FCB group bacterium]